VAVSSLLARIVSAAREGQNSAKGRTSWRFRREIGPLNPIVDAIIPPTLQWIPMEPDPQRVHQDLVDRRETGRWAGVLFRWLKATRGAAAQDTVCFTLILKGSRDPTAHPQHRGYTYEQSG
jgi:hypothetical protein